MQNRKFPIDSEFDKMGVPKRTQSDKKCHVIFAVTFSGDHYFEILPRNKSVNGQYYVNFLKNAHKKLSHLRIPMSYRNLILIYDKAWPHVSSFVKKFITSKKVKVYN